MKKVVTNKYFLYLLCFFGIVVTLLLGMFNSGHFAVGGSDAIAQHYPAMFYIRRLLAGFVQALLDGEKFVFPMVDFTVGMGADTIASLNWYGLGDPFYLLTLFSTESGLPQFYSLLFYLKIFLAGIAFIAFASELDGKKSTGAYVAGALVYSFTGFTLESNVHIIFTSAMIYIPLLMLGAERSINDKKKGVLCIAVFCFGLTGFYFLYVGSIALAVYVIYRLWGGKRTFGDAAAKIGQLVLEYALGLGMAAVVFIPAMAGVFQSNRIRIKSVHPIIMPWSSVVNMLKNMVLSSYSKKQILSVCTIGVIVIICVLFDRRRRREKVNLALLFLIAIIPFVSFVMSGFGVTYQRWELVIDMYIAFLVVSVWDELENITVVQKLALAAVYPALIYVGRDEDIFGERPLGNPIVSFGVIFAGIVILMPLCRKIGQEKLGRILFFLIVYMTIRSTWKMVELSWGTDLIEQRQVVRELVGDDAGGGFYRIENEAGFMEPRLGMNISLYQGYNGTLQYISVTNKYYAGAFRKWDISAAGWSVPGLDERAILETMCAVRYFVVRTESANIVPYGFEYVKSTDDGEWELYENGHSLPVVYAYDAIYDVESYQELAGLEKQQVMLRAAAAEGYEGTLPRLEYLDADLAVGGIKNIVKNGTKTGSVDGTVGVEAGDEIKFTVDMKADGENYLVYTGKPGQFSAEIRFENGYTKYSRNISPQVINLGTVKEDRDMELSLVFGKKAEFDIKTLQTAYHDLSGYGDYIDALKEDTDGRFAVEVNRISGTLDLPRGKFLCVSVPYSKGWYARIDGKPSKVYLVNDLFMGVEVAGGVHDVEFYYVTPGIRAGTLISLASFVMAGAYVVFCKRGGKVEN